MAKSWLPDTNFWAESSARRGRTPSLQTLETVVHCRPHHPRFRPDGPRSAPGRRAASAVHPAGHRRPRRGGRGRGTCGDSTGPARRIGWSAGAFWEFWRRMTFSRVYHSTPPTCETSRIITTTNEDVTVESERDDAEPLPETSFITDSMVALRSLDIWHPISQRKPSCLAGRELLSGIR